MSTFTLPSIPREKQLAEAAEKFGQMLIDESSPVERRFIRDYGRTLISDNEPGYGLTVYFHRELSDLSPRLKGYGVQLARMSIFPEMISDLQCRIAMYVARTDAEQGVK